MPSFIPKYSDPDIIKGIINSDYWRYLFLGESKALWILVKAMILFKMEMFVSPLRSVLRYNHGRRTIGFFIWMMSTLMLIAFNTDYLVGYLATFFPFVSPIILFIFSGEQLYDGIFVSIRSPYLLYFWICYSVLALIHLTVMYYGWGTPQGDDAHGTSVLHSFLGKRMGLSEAFVKIFLEPLVVAGIGYYLLISETDFTFGLFLIISASCLFFHEVRNAVLRYGMS